MKKIITLLMAMAVTSAIGTTAMAADETVTGFYNIGEANGVVITPYADDAAVSVTEKNIDDDADLEKIYIDANKLDVTYSGASANEHYGIILVEGSALPTKDTEVYYINQETATGSSVAFNAGIKVPEETKDMTLYISTSKAGTDLVSVPMNYAVNAAVAEDEPEYRLGDTNGDGDVTVKDVIPIRRYITGGFTVTMDERAADVNKDGQITVKDVIPIRRYITGGFGVEL